MNRELITLQEITAHQQDEIARLSDELYAQQKEITSLRADLASLRAMLKASAGDGFQIRSQAEETPPPHY
jgi:uncharacterized coiled-coil protein SlyX